MPLIEHAVDVSKYEFSRIRDHQDREDPRIAVILTAFNEQKLLPYALASIDRALAQIPDSVRVVVVDNNSTDSTNQIAHDSGATVIFEANRRISSARQAGLDSLPESVELVLTTDADTIVPPGWIGAYLYLLDQTAIVGAYGPVEYVFEETPFIGQALSFWILMTSFKMMRQFKASNNMSIVSGANSAYLRNAAAGIGGYNTDLEKTEDAELFKRLQNIGRLEKVDSNVRTSNRRIINRGLFNHLLRRLYANYYYIRHNKWPDFQSDQRQNIRF